MLVMVIFFGGRRGNGRMVEMVVQQRRLWSHVRGSRFTKDQKLVL
jgi:hypothetical protein